MLTSGMLEGMEVYMTMGAAPAEYEPPNLAEGFFFWPRDAEGTGLGGWWRIGQDRACLGTIRLLTGLR